MNDGEVNRATDEKSNNAGYEAESHAESMTFYKVHKGSAHNRGKKQFYHENHKETTQSPMNHDA